MPERVYALFALPIIKAIPHKARLAALHAICLLIFRHIAQKSLAIRQYACGISMQSAEKSSYASYAQALCGIAIRKEKGFDFMAVKQTAGRDALGEFAPKFAELNDDVLFGEVWSREEELSLRDRSLVTVVSLIAMGLTDNSFRYHLESAKKNGITASEMAEIITHVAFYVGWPKAWAAFRMAKEVYEA